jgi:hypothetical protein
MAGSEADQQPEVVIEGVGDRDRWASAVGLGRMPLGRVRLP